MKTIFHKLVRDKIPQIIEAQGEKVSIRILDDTEYTQCLRKKLDEEVAEFHQSNDPEELADILEVVFALGEDMGFTKEDLMEISRKKNEKCGRFQDRIFLLSKEG